VSNRYGFRVETVAGVLPFQHLVEENSSRPAPETVAARHQNSSSAATQQSKDNLIDNLILESAPPSSSFGNDAVVAKEEKKGVGEEGGGLPVWTTPSLDETEYTPELRKVYERAEEVYTPGPVPQRFWRKRKQTPEEFDAEMAASGMDMSASRRRQGATGFQGYVLNARHSA
jgi:hypothetical protein